ncbi:hypothetical protein [Oceanobacillus profundus]|uniref:hypothetical protein n=1 Tax=Oceanobacillus profundus TaxID=372463 RepID=UPI001313DD7B|nr:hypothetical protein [Oceanobacillus profundus]
MNERIKYAVQEPFREDSYDLLKQFLGGMDRDYFIVVCSDRKISRQPLTYSRLNPPITG